LDTASLAEWITSVVKNLFNSLKNIIIFGLISAPMFIGLYERDRGNTLCMILGSGLFYAILFGGAQYERKREAEKKLSKIHGIVFYGDETVAEKFAKINSILRP
jgi:hypothetical protein